MTRDLYRERRGVVILGSTGSIGRQAIEVIGAHPDRFEIVGLVAHRSEGALRRQVDELRPRHHGLGEAAAIDLAAHADADIVLNAVVGAAGLRASLAALRAGKTLALANKESLVAGGEVCLAAAAEGGGRIVPVDSEHAALTQCLDGSSIEAVSRLVLTASGGPFRGRADLTSVTREEALAHPTWSMGPKITVDSASLMNKGLELIEAHFLFGLDYDQLDAVVHPQSLVHAIVEFVDGSSLLQAAPPDMRVPIQAALTWPDRTSGLGKPVDLADVGTIEFEPLDHDRFPAVGLALRAGRLGRTYPAALNAANEEAVAAFLEGGIRFSDIPAVIEKVIGGHDPLDASDLAAVLEADAWARRRATEAMREMAVTTKGSAP